MEGTECSQPRIERDVVKAGDFGRRPSLGWKCNARLELENAVPSEIESDYLKGGDVTEIAIGSGNWAVDKAIESCVEMMHVNEESRFRVMMSPTFELRLVIALESCTEKGYIFQWTDREKLDASKSFKRDGVELFRRDRIAHAFHKFSKALKLLLLVDSDVSELDESLDGGEVVMTLYNNLANCQFHYKNYEYVIELCNKSVSIRENVKGYFRRALAYIELKEYEKAESDLLALLKIEPKNKAALEKYKLVRLLDKTNRDNYEAIVKNMFR